LIMILNALKMKNYYCTVALPDIMIILTGAIDNLAVKYQQI